MHLADTIVAVSSATGPAARMIVRAAGPEAFDLLRRFAPGVDPAHAAAQPVRLLLAGVSCLASVYSFHGPHSYTGDDTIELHLPGNPLLARMLLDTLVVAGARLASPGEFTARAFFNGRLDLAAAEGVALTIAATHAAELAAARRMMAGEVSGRVDPPMQELADVLALLESNLDFADEGISFVDADAALARVSTVAASLHALRANAITVGDVARVPTFVLVGRPNAGKSTLLNALAGQARAVASPVAGTTRDVLSADVLLPGGTVRLIDSAGLDPYGKGSPVEREILRDMQRRANAAVEEADFVIEVVDAATVQRAWLPRAADIQVWTKTETVEPSAIPADAIAVSAFTGIGIGALKQRLATMASLRSHGDALALTARQAEALDAAQAALDPAGPAAAAGAEVLADVIRRALDALGQIRGVVTPDDVLGRVFAGFCIGK